MSLGEPASLDPGNRGEYTVSLNCNDSLTIAGNSLFLWRTTPANSEPLSLELVNDTFDLQRGPAWFRMLPYNKTILLPSDALTPPELECSDFRPNTLGVGLGDYKRKNLAQVGDRPWLCTWPQTYLEIFIYAQQNSSYNKPTTSHQPRCQAPPAPPPFRPALMVVMVHLLPRLSRRPLGREREQPPPPDAPSSTDNTIPVQLSPYPRVFKIEERRIDGSSGYMLSDRDQGAK